jgi:hypothetical protein
MTLEDLPDMTPQEREIFDALVAAIHQQQAQSKIEAMRMMTLVTVVMDIAGALLARMLKPDLDLDRVTTEVVKPLVKTIEDYRRDPESNPFRTMRVT